MAKGKVVQVIGSVVDIEFPSNKLPQLFNSIEIEQEGSRIVLEVQGHIGNNRARCLSLMSTDGLARGAIAEDSGDAIKVPVGTASLGRIFNVLGEPLDDIGPVKADEY